MDSHKAGISYQPASGSDQDSVPKNQRILHRRHEENLPLFGELVEHADAHHLRYHEHEDARNIELFFDLFFVAIFSTFTKNHEINSNEALSSYATYFGVIWASWLQVCLFDVRFGSDSMFERFTKAVQMCLFIGFASTTGSLKMNPAPKDSTASLKISDLSAFESLNVLMIVSRALFSLQYIAAWFFVGRKHRPARMPLLITAGMYAVSSIIYLLLFKLVLLATKNTESFYGYYAIIFFELSVISWVVYRWECVSFRDTHLHKRLMVLTLMILGEGIIVCSFTFAKISSKSGWTANSFAQALSIVLSIYFVYCLYFGNSGIERARAFRPAKQQIYLMLHLPFHLALALTLEGLRTWAVVANVQYNFKKVYGYIDKVIGDMPDVYRLAELNATTGEQIVGALNTSAKSFGFESSSSWGYMQTALAKMELAFQDDASVLGVGVPGAEAGDKSGILKFYYDEFTSLVQNEQFAYNSLVIPDVQIEAANGSGIAKMEAYFEIFKMIFIYFFVCTALVMILLSVFRAMSIGPRDRYDNVMISVRAGSGVLLGLLALLALMNDNITNYMNSGVLLPTLLFILIFVVSFEKMLTVVVLRRNKGPSPYVDGYGENRAAWMAESTESTDSLAKPGFDPSSEKGDDA